jgi:hypothetical protein
MDGSRFIPRAHHDTDLSQTKNETCGQLIFLQKKYSTIRINC